MIMNDLDKERQTEGSKAWYAIQTFYCKEEHLGKYLEEKGVNYFIPMRFVEYETLDGKKHRKLTPAVHNLLFIEKEFTEKEIDKILEDLDHPYVSGLSLLGGEPLEYSNQKGLLPLVKKVKEKFPDKNIWCYSGYTFEKDIKDRMCKNWKETPELLSYIDVLVDGKFEEDKKDLSLRFRGSSNQRIIDVQKSLKENKTVLFEL